MAQFIPKQRLPLTPAIMQELMGHVSLQVAHRCMALVPPMTSSSLVLDNACGNGVVTEAIMEAQSPGIFIIHATDINPKMCEATAALAASKGWQNDIRTAAMPSESLEFDDNTFTHSFSNFIINQAQDPEKVAANIYRTLKPDGIAIVTTWAEMPQENAIREAHITTRGPDAYHKLIDRWEWKSASHLVSLLEKAGFSDVKTLSCDSVLEIENLDRWAKLAWSFMGAPLGPAGGWVEADEAKFDEAVTVMHSVLAKSEGIEMDGHGGAKAKMVANVAIARKS